MKEGKSVIYGQFSRLVSVPNRGGICRIIKAVFLLLLLFYCFYCFFFNLELRKTLKK